MPKYRVIQYYQYSVCFDVDAHDADAALDAAEALDGTPEGGEESTHEYVESQVERIQEED